MMSIPMKHAFCLAVTMGACLAATQAQDTTQPAGAREPPQRLVPQATAGGEWSLFSSPEAGIELKMPPGQPVPSDEATVLAQVVDAERSWKFELRRLPLETPMNLAPEEMPEGGRRAGLLELMASTAQQNTQGEILRQGLTPLGDADAGVYAIRFSLGLSTQLQQVALIRASDTLYYQVMLTSPAPAGPIEQIQQDPAVREAVEAFQTSLNSFKVLDQSELREEQEQRLIRTRSLLVNITKPRILEVLQPEQWLLIRRDGQDIGYSYLVEEPAREIPGDPMAREVIDDHGATGIRIGSRTHLRRDGGWLDRETWLFATTDLREEEFRERNVLRVEGQEMAENLVIGNMLARQVPHSVPIPGPGGIGREKGFTVVDSRKLDVTYVVNAVQTGEPLNRQLPAWYLPQAIEHLLPRLVAPWGRNTYLVAVYNPEKREVYQKYVDVEGLRNEMVQGQERLVMVVTTRLGFSGPRTRHFVDPESFDWLGSVSEEDGLEIWPTNAQTINEIFKDANLTVPDVRQRPAE